MGNCKLFLDRILPVMRRQYFDRRSHANLSNFINALKLCMLYDALSFSRMFAHMCMINLNIFLLN